MKNFIIYFFSFLLLFSFKYSFSQANLLNAKVPQEIGIPNEQQLEADDETPIAYGFVEDRDVMWSKTIWEKIDLDERINFPLGARALLTDIRAGYWNQWHPKAVKIYAQGFAEQDIEGQTDWFDITEGKWIQALLAQNKNESRICNIS